MAEVEPGPAPAAEPEPVPVDSADAAPTLPPVHPAPPAVAVPAALVDLVRAGQSSEKAALIYQHSDDERQAEVAAGLDATVRKARAAARGKQPDRPSGADLARDE